MIVGKDIMIYRLKQIVCNARNTVQLALTMRPVQNVMEIIEISVRFVNVIRDIIRVYMMNSVISVMINAKKILI